MARKATPLGPEELWRPIEDFPDYEINQFGDVANIHNDAIIRPSRNQQGTLKIGLRLNGRTFTKSVKVLVADAHIQKLDARADTPILLDNNQENVSVSNIAWRPRWFAWQYARQFNVRESFYEKGPIENEKTLEVYHTVIDAAIADGLLAIDVWDSIHTGKLAMPGGHRFRLYDN